MSRRAFALRRPDDDLLSRALRGHHRSDSRPGLVRRHAWRDRRRLRLEDEEARGLHNSARVVQRPQELPLVPCNSVPTRTARPRAKRRIWIYCLKKLSFGQRKETFFPSVRFAPLRASFG